MSRNDIEFDAEGTTLRGWFYTPDGATGPVPTIVMAHGYAAVKEMDLDRFAEAFADAGLAALVYDNRNLGASDGTPRQEIDPWAQVRDYRHAITYATSHKAVDRDRIGVWGSSYSAGHVIPVSAMDRRVKAVVSQVPMISGHANFRALVRADFIAGFQAQFVADREARYHGERPAMVPVVAEDPLAPSALPTPDSWDWFTTTHRLRAPAFRNECTLRSVELFSEYEPGTYLPFISPTPLLMCVAENDVLTPTSIAIAGYEQAREPKKLAILPGGHFDAYGDGFDVAVPIEVAWFTKHLLGKTSTG